MTFESLFNWNEITCEWAEYLDKNDIFKNMQDNNLYFLRVVRLLTGLHALFLCNNFDQAKITIVELLADMAKLKTAGIEEKLISTKVLSHVVHATIQKSLEKMNLHNKAKEVEKNVTPLIMTTSIEKSTLYGIRSFCLYQYFQDQANQMAINFAKKALNLNPNCSYWNLIYALCLRKSRRDFRRSGNPRIPSPLEKKYFEIAYSQNNHPYFGIRLAQCYKESRVDEKAVKMFDEVKQLHIEVPDIWLRLAMGFMYYKKFEPAKECLDEADKMDASMEMLYHYKGLYYMKGCKNYDEAIIHLKKASDLGDYKAFIDYLSCLYCKNPNDRRVLILLEDAIEIRKCHKFELGLNIALYYGENLNDYEKALTKLSDVVKENPQDGYLNHFFYPFTDKSNYMNIFHYIETELLPKSKPILDSNNRKAWEAHNYLRDLAVKNNSSKQFKKQSKK